MEYYKKYHDRKVLTKNIVDALIREFYYYLSDDSRQDASTTTAYITDIINMLVTNNIIKKYVSKILEETDGCEKYYICENILTIINDIFKVKCDNW